MDIKKSQPASKISNLDWLTKAIQEKGFQTQHPLQFTKKKRPFKKPAPKKLPITKYSSQTNTLNNYFTIDNTYTPMQSLSKGFLNNEMSTEVGTNYHGQDSFTFNHDFPGNLLLHDKTEKIDIFTKKQIKPASLDKDFRLETKIKVNSDNIIPPDEDFEDTSNLDLKKDSFYGGYSNMSENNSLEKRGYIQFKSEEDCGIDQKPFKELDGMLKSDQDCQYNECMKTQQIHQHNLEEKICISQNFSDGNFYKKEDFLTEAQNLLSRFDFCDRNSNVLGLDSQPIKQEHEHTEDSMDNNEKLFFKQKIKQESHKPSLSIISPPLDSESQGKFLGARQEDTVAQAQDFYNTSKKLKVDIGKYANYSNNDTRSQSFMSQSYSGVGGNRRLFGNCDNNNRKDTIDCSNYTVLSETIKSELDFFGKDNLKAEDFGKKEIPASSKIEIKKVDILGKLVGKVIDDSENLKGLQLKMDSVKQYDANDNNNGEEIPETIPTQIAFQIQQIQAFPEKLEITDQISAKKPKKRPNQKKFKATKSNKKQQILPGKSCLDEQESSNQQKDIECQPKVKTVEEEIAEFDLLEQKILKGNKKFPNYELYKHINCESLTELYKDHSKQINYDLMMNDNFNNNMRILLFDWMSEVAHDFEMTRTTFHKSLKLLDKFLSKKSISKEQLQLYGAVCLSLAVKIDEVYCPYLKDFVKAGGCCFTEEDIELGEIDLCQTLDWQIGSTNFAEIANYISVLWDRYITKGLSVYFDKKISYEQKDKYKIFSQIVVGDYKTNMEGSDSDEDDNDNIGNFSRSKSTQDTNSVKKKLRSSRNRPGFVCKKGPISMNEDPALNVKFVKQKINQKVVRSFSKKNNNKKICQKSALIKSLERHQTDNRQYLRYPNKESYKFYSQFVFLIDLLVYNPLHFNHNPIELILSCLYITLKKHVNPDLLFNDFSSGSDPDNFSCKKNITEYPEQQQHAQFTSSRKASESSLFKNFLDKMYIDVDDEIWIPQNKLGMFAPLIDEVHEVHNTNNNGSYVNSFYVSEDEQNTNENSQNLLQIAEENKISIEKQQQKIEEGCNYNEHNVKIEPNSLVSGINIKHEDFQDGLGINPCTKLEVGCGLQVKSEEFKHELKSQVRIPFPSLDKEQEGPKQKACEELDSINALFENFVEKVVKVSFQDVRKLSEKCLGKFAKEVEYSRYPIAVERDKSKFHKDNYNDFLDFHIHKENNLQRQYELNNCFL